MIFQEPMMFPLAKLLICIATNDSTTKKTLRKVKPLLEQIRDAEYVKRTMIGDLGVKVNERIVLKSSKKQEQDDEYECEICSENLYVSYVSLKILAFLPFFLLFFYSKLQLQKQTSCARTHQSTLL